MKSFKNYIISEASFETSRLATVDPRSVGSILSVGFASLPLRTFQNNTDRMRYIYQYDKRDGWFRALPGERVVGEIGLMIRDVKLSSKKMPVRWNPSMVLYPVNVTYLPIERDEDAPKDYMKAQMTMYINTDLDSSIQPEDVIRYCKKNAKNWIP